MLSPQQIMTQNRNPNTRGILKASIHRRTRHKDAVHRNIFARGGVGLPVPIIQFVKQTDTLTLF